MPEIHTHIDYILSSPFKINTPACIKSCTAPNLAETVYKSDHKSKSLQSNREQRKK